jgi:CheY-like chemotaxis protein
MRKKDYDVILMDVHMPEMNGIDATKEIRKSFGKDKQPYIVALTASVFTEERDACIEAGMDDFVSKPISPDTLAEAIMRSLGHDGMYGTVKCVCVRVCVYGEA